MVYRSTVDPLLPLKSIDFYILITLIEDPLHGYEIKKRIYSQMKDSISTSSLYRHMGRMEGAGLIERFVQAEEKNDSRRQYFQITELGKMVYEAEYSRLSELLQNAPKLNVGVQN